MEKQNEASNSLPMQTLLQNALDAFCQQNKGAQPLNLSQEQMEKLCCYWDMVKEQNRVMNLTRVTDDESAAVLHFTDSLAPLFFGLLPQGASLCDLGTGAGFPGVPLQIARPDLRITLVDSLQKRVTFLENVKQALHLPLTVLHARAEEFGHGDRREHFDFVAARAVARVQVLSEWTLPLCRVGGALLCYKGPALQEELAQAQNAIRTLGGGKEEILPYTLPNVEEGGHQLYLLHKRMPTPKPYPRKGSAKKPIA